MVQDISALTEELNEWQFQSKMNFNPNPSKEAYEVLFSRKLHKVSHPKMFSNNADIFQTNFHKTSLSGIRL